MMQTGDSQIIVTPTGEFDTEAQIGGLIVADTPSGLPVYLRDLGEAWRTYTMPPPLLNYYTWRDDDGTWRRSPAVTLGVQMRDGEQIADLEVEVNTALGKLADGLPEDLILERTSGSTAPGKGEHQPVPGRAVRGGPAGRHRRLVRLLGLEIGAADDDLDPTDIADDVRFCQRHGNSDPAGFGRDPDHCPRAAG